MTVDLVHLALTDRSVVFAITAVVDLHGGQPRLTGLAIDSDHGLDHVRLQREFRWATPLDIVRRAVPALLARGIDPFEYDFPADGYPTAADLGRPRGWALTDDFLEEIAYRYLELGRGYAQAIAFERGVAPRTAISWVEKARARGILSRVPPGSHGGHVMPSGQRRPDGGPEVLGRGRQPGGGTRST